jgi:hypothetical protein
MQDICFKQSSIPQTTTLTGRSVLEGEVSMEAWSAHAPAAEDRLRCHWGTPRFIALLHQQTSADDKVREFLQTEWSKLKVCLPRASD